MDKYIGRKLEGRYEVQELIGFGGMAVVYKAYDLLEKRYVAVKVLKDEYLQNDDFKRRFRNESKAIALLSHPCIVKVYDVNFSDHIQYIVMEYIDGITLKEYITQKKQVPWKEAVHFTIQILRALQHAHDNGIVHRDVKPQNVMLMEDGSIKVMDFGIARFARESGRTMSDKAIGSVHYISPEQASGDKTDEKTDIYSVGVILYEMLTGKVPFDGENAVAIAIKQMQIEPPLPSSVNPGIPTGLEEIILRAMQKDPQLRYQTAAEMQADIDEFKRDPGVVFEYKYLNPDGTTKYFNAPKTRKNGSRVMVEQPKKKGSYVMNILAGITAACVLLAMVAVFFFFRGINNKPAEVQLQNYIGMTVEEAQNLQPDVKFVVVEELPSLDYEKGIIIDQNPLKDIRVKINTEVQVTVSSGLGSLVMLDLTNETSSAAKAKLNAMGITEVEIIQKTDASVAVGRVISSDPAPDTELKKGDKIILYVSSGAPDLPIQVPSLLDQSEIEARATLARAGLSVGSVEVVPSAEQRGIVIWQSVEPGEKVHKDTKIDLQISDGSGAGPSYNGPTLAVTIPFPAGADDRHRSFYIYLDDTLIDYRSVNPAEASYIQMMLYLDVAQMRINGMVPATSANRLTIRIDHDLFAEYSVNVLINQTSVISPPNYDLIFAGGYGNEEDPPVSDPEEDPESDPEEDPETDPEETPEE